MANVTFQSILCDDGVHSANLQVPTLGSNINVVFTTAGNVLTDQSTFTVTSVKSTTTTGVVQFTGMTTGTTRVKTVTDQNDTILELSGSYTPTGTWNFGSATVSGLTVTGVKSTTTTGIVQFTGMTAGQTRVKTVTDLNDTILELSGSYSPAGTWDYSSATFTIPRVFYATGALAFELPPTGGNISGTMWAKKSVTTLSSWTTAASIIGAANTGVGTLTIPANSLAIGDTIRISLRGVYSHASSGTTFALSMTLGGTQVFTSGTLTTGTGTVTNSPWYAHADLVCIATGASSTILSGSFFQGSDFGGASGSITSVSIDTTQANVIDIKMACGNNSAGNIMSCVIARISRE
jgi:hypothetical protein